MRILAPQRHEPFVGQTERIAKRPEMLLHKAGIEAVVARGHRSMRCKSNFAGHARYGLIEIHAFFLHAAANRLEHRKTAVPFVQMKNARRDSHGPKSAKTSNAKQQLLTNSDAAVATVQPRSEFPVLGRIPFDIRVEQQEVAASYFHAPDLRANGSATRLDLHRDRLALGPDRRFHWQQIDIGGQIFFLLPAAAVQPLAEISLAVKQADAHQRNTQVGRALDVIAGQHAEPPGIYGNRLMQAEFSGKIRDGTWTQDARVPRSPGPIRIKILSQAAICVVH